MRRLRRRMTAVLTALLLLTLLIPWGLAEPAPGPHQTTVLFTHDLHSHFLPLERADGGESGGYARLASALEQQRALHPDALTLDGGDFSIGSLVQTLYTTRAAELRTMGALGYVMNVPEEEKYLNTKKELEAMLVEALAGRAAEELVFDSVTTGASNDIEKATNLARAMITRYGMSQDFDMVALETVQNQYLGGDASLACSAETAAEIDRQVVELVKRQHEKANRILSENREKLDELARYLYEKETITGDEFMEILNQ